MFDLKVNEGTYTQSHGSSRHESSTPHEIHVTNLPNKRTKILPDEATKHLFRRDFIVIFQQC